MAKDKKEVLLQLLQDYDIQVDRDVIKAAFAEPELLEAWMDEYLGPETLLTKEEATLYSMLTKKGEADELASSARLETIRGINDQDLEDAIEELKRSTAAIEKQIDAIKLSKAALSSLKKTSASTHQARSEVDTEQIRKWISEGEHIRNQAEALSKDLSLHASELEARQKLSDANLKRSVDELLKSDDKLLSDLQKIASKAETRSQGNDEMSRIKELSAKLIKYTVEGVRTRLDRIYLSSLNKSTGTEDSQNASSQEVKDLQEEIESLYSEILPVAQMAVEQQYLQPALREISTRDGQSTENSLKVMKYIDECVGILLQRTEAFVERVEEFQCYKMAAGSILETTQKELLQEIKPSQPSQTSPPRRSRSNSVKQRTPSFPAQIRGTSRTRRSTLMLEEDLEPEEQILRSLGISIPPEAKSSVQRAKALDQALTDRSSKLDKHATGLQSTIESSISAHIHDAYITLQLLRDVQLSDTPYRTVQLLDSKLESSLKEFQTEIEHVQQTLAEVDLQSLEARNVHREQIIQRWSR
ncbi:hypothetical protein F5884DRAFT_772613 [Xylogone sp. PMI_703]|nr:hypothetical protein F5884DRAFT_772613 [Xylogone sp. PMI_703]